MQFSFSLLWCSKVVQQNSLKFIAEGEGRWDGLMYTNDPFNLLTLSFFEIQIKTWSLRRRNPFNETFQSITNCKSQWNVIVWKCYITYVNPKSVITYQSFINRVIKWYFVVPFVNLQLYSLSGLEPTSTWTQNGNSVDWAAILWLMDRVKMWV